MKQLMPHHAVQQRSRRGRQTRRSQWPNAGYSLTELLVVVCILILLSAISSIAMQDQWRNEQTYGVAQELAAWLGNVQRAAMRGARCDITIAPNANPVSNGQEMASVSQTAGTSLSTSCLTYSPLTLESVPSPSEYSLTPRLLTFSFTPRGTIANSSADPVVITITNRAGGPARCVRLDGLLAALRVGYLVGTTCQA